MIKFTLGVLTGVVFAGIFVLVNGFAEAFQPSDENRSRFDTIKEPASDAI